MSTEWARVCHEAAMSAGADAEAGADPGAGAEVAAALEARVASDPNDVEARVKLVGCYFLASLWPDKQGVRGEHLAWLARNRPDVGLGGYGTLIAELAPEQHAVALAAWRDVALGPDVDLATLHNAASFIGFEHPEEAAELYRRASAREPAAYEWRKRRAQRLLAAARRDDAERPEVLAAEAVEELRTALALTDVDWIALGLRIDLLEALQLAERWDELAETARRVLADNETCRRTFQYGNAIHDAHLALGWCAYVGGDFAGGAACLRRAGKTPGSPQLDSFGPDFELARALLAAGEREAVLDYIEDCKRFWKGEEAWLMRCYELVAAGGDEAPRLTVERQSRASQAAKSNGGAAGATTFFVSIHVASAGRPLEASSSSRSPMPVLPCESFTKKSSMLVATVRASPSESRSTTARGASFAPVSRRARSEPSGRWRNT
ncbi:MAG: hypothetical protein KIT84_15065 [Labilithrix sp.]|nr:hypothetical protein [Labilithrix sp.]MCW5812344.1 hypothetical protein [Labilithrix sp.]